MALFELERAYVRLTGKQLPSMYTEDLLLACLLAKKRTFIKLIPYLKKLTPQDLGDIRLLSISVSKEFNEDYYNKFSYIEYERRMAYVCAPPLWTVLMYYSAHFTALNFIFNNWELFYETIDDFVKNIFYYLVLLGDGGFYDVQLPQKSKSYNVLIKFLKRNNGIRMLNNYQNVSNINYLNYDTIRILIADIDFAGEYQVRNNYKFFILFAHNGKLFQEMFNRYHANSIDTNYDFLIRRCLIEEFYDAYLVLYNAGIKIQTLDLNGLEIANLNDKVNLLYTIRHLLPLNAKPVEIYKVCRNVASSRYCGLERFKHLKVIIDILDYNLEVSNQEN